jgi:hypothetical protein
MTVGRRHVIFGTGDVGLATLDALPLGVRSTPADEAVGATLREYRRG